MLRPDATIEIYVGGEPRKVIPVFGPDQLDVLYIPIRDEYAETEQQAEERVDRILEILNRRG